MSLMVLVLSTGHALHVDDTHRVVIDCGSRVDLESARIE